MARLPIPGQDNGIWGDVLNEFLAVTHQANGSLKSGVISDSHLSGNLPQSRISGLETALASKAAASSTYTKTEVDTALSAKADTASLAAVATTGNYNELINKPTMTSLGGDDRYYTKSQTAPVLVLDDGASVPVGTPEGTVVFFRSP